LKPERFISELFILIISIIIGGVIFKAGVLAKKSQPNRPQRPIPLLADDHFGYAFIRTVFVVNLVPVDKND
jgi:hypothetical protein